MTHRKYLIRFFTASVYRPLACYNAFFVRFILKRKFFIILLVFGLSAVVFAQGRERNEPRHKQGEAVSVTGTLVVANGMPALQSGDATYLLGGIHRLVGFVDGLKEGAQVTVEGTSVTFPRDGKLKILRPSKLTLNGKSYDFAARPKGNFNPGKEWGHMAPPRGRNFNPGQGNHGPQNRWQKPNFWQKRQY